MDFLPEMIRIETNETIRDYIERLYQYYLDELKTEDFNYKGLFIYHKSEPDVDGKDGGFWHIITKDYYDDKSNRAGVNRKRPVSLPCKAGNGMPICIHNCRGFRDYDPYRTENIFYSNEKKADPRFICLNRCERISWIKTIINEAEMNPDKFKIWEKRDKKYQINTHIWLEDEDFLIVIGRWKKEDKYNMITSFVTNYKSKRRQCERNYQKYINNGSSPI